MRIIPGKTKVGLELFRGITLADLIIGAVAVALAALILVAGVPYKLYYLCGILLAGVLLVIRVDDEPMYKTVVAVVLHYFAYRHLFRRFRLVPGEQTENQEEEPILSRKERKAQKKAEKKERKADDKLLRSHKLSKEEEDAIWLKRANQSKAKKSGRKKAKAGKKYKSMDDIVGFTEISDGMIRYQQGYYGIVLEIPPVEFRFFSKYRRNVAIENGVGAVLRNINQDYCANIVKLDRPIYFDHYIQQEREKAVQLRNAFENGVIREDELQSRIEVIYDRVADLERMNEKNRIINGGYFVVLYDSNASQLINNARNAVQTLENGGMNPHRLNDKELALFLKYSNCMDFDERELDHIAPEDYAQWAKPRSVQIRSNTVVVNDVITYNFRITKFPLAVGDAWLASVMSLPGTKVVIKAQPMDSARSIRSIDHSLQELRGQYMNTGVDSKRIELQNHIDSLEQILATLQTDNEQLLCTNVYITAYDIVNSRKDGSLHPSQTAPYAQFDSIRKTVRRLYKENGFRLNSMQFGQSEAFVGSQPNGYDPLKKEARGIPSNTLAACFPWIFASINDDKGVKFGSSDGIPVFIDFFRRDSERVNSNMVIVGKSGSGKSYATKSILTNLAADDSKIFVLDPEDEYSELAKNLHGKFINVGNAQYGRLNPFQIITSLSDDEEGGENVSGSYATHLQFLEEFFKQILPDCNKDALEYLNALLDRLYTNMGITAETDLRALKPEDYPIFDDLYDAVLKEFQTANNDYIRSMLRTLINYISKFSADGRNANIWNGPSTITTEENFTVFNFQSMLANRNGTIANAQMLLVLKYIDNEIIKNREYNTKNHTNRKIIVVIDEAHVFIDTKYPVALDFMFQLAKRIRKYNGMQIVITQNIKDFVGSEEIARKSTAIINACQYSFIFALSPNDIEDLCKLYEKAGGINEKEQEEIVSAPRGRAFAVMSSQLRSTFTMQVPKETVSMFEQPDYQTHFFGDEAGQQYWDDFIGDGREKYRKAYLERHPVNEEKTELHHVSSKVSMVEMSEDELLEEQTAAANTNRGVQLLEETDFSSAKERSVRSASELFDAEMLPSAGAANTMRPAADASAANAHMEQLLEQMTGVMRTMRDFSYDAILGRVQDMVRKEMTDAPRADVSDGKPLSQKNPARSAAADEDALWSAASPSKSEESPLGTEDEDLFGFDDEALFSDEDEDEVTTGSDKAWSSTDATEDEETDFGGSLLDMLVGLDEEPDWTLSDSEGADSEETDWVKATNWLEDDDSDDDSDGNDFDIVAQLADVLADSVKTLDCYTEMKQLGEMHRVITLADLNVMLQNWHI